MAVVGGIIWGGLSVIYAMKYKQGVKARKWYGIGAYFGLALFTGGILETFHDKLQGPSTMWIMLAVVVFCYLMAKIYLLNNIKY